MCCVAATPDSARAAGLPAVILAAGEGSRLSRGKNGVPKPAVRLLGLSLAERTLTSCMAAGVGRFVIVLGHRADEVRAHFEGIAARRGYEVEYVTASHWQLGNGASALSAKDTIGESRFLLAMVDHLVTPSLLERVMESTPTDGEICLAIDPDKAEIFDVEDVTKVTVSMGRVTGIGKQLEPWDAADTGVFLCTRGLFEGLELAAKDNRHSLSDGVAELAGEGRVHAVDVSGQIWLDIDTAEAHREGKRRLLASLSKGAADGYVSTYLNRPISTRLSALLAETRVTPDQITIASFLLTLAGAALLALGQYAWGALGGVLVQLASIIDGCDGEIARLKRMGSARGGWLDTVLDRYGDLAVALAITFAFAAGQPSPWPWVAGFVATSSFLLASYVTKEYALQHGRGYPSDVLNRLKRRDLRLLGLAVGAVMGYPYEALLVLGLVTHLCVGGILVRGWTMNAPVSSRESGPGCSGEL